MTKNNLIDFRQQTDVKELRATICVVGSGPAGAIVAVELARAGIEVLVVEAGSKAPDHDSDTLDRLEVSGSTDLRFNHARQLGGATNLWAGRLAPFEAIDFQKRDWVEGSGWPFPQKEIEPYYRKVGGVLGIPGAEYFASRRTPGHNFLSSSTIETKPFQWAKKPFLAGDYIESAMKQFPNLKLVLNAPVVRLVESDNTQTVEAAEFVLPGGATGQIHARYFVLAAGGLETPRLLLNSTTVRESGIGNDHDVVGRYLSTHPKANMASLILNKAVSTNHALFTDEHVTGGLLRYGIGLSADTQKQHRLLNHYVQLLPFLEYQANTLFEKIKGSGTMDSPLIDRTPLIRGIVPGFGLMVFEVLGRLGRFQHRARKFILRAFLDQYPDRNNRLILSSTSDSNGMPKVDVKWVFSERDRASVLDFFKLMDEDVVARGIGNIEYQKLRETDDWPIIGIHSHFMGATRMGTDPAVSVTNGDCRVHGSHNLFVAGPSLFPVYGYANPVYTIGALSLRLADYLKEIAG
jgi:choline dehydrogenase-like flavoprotein